MARVRHERNHHVTLEEIIREVGYSAKDSQVQLDLKSFVNRAIRTIAERADWSAMHDRRPVSIAPGFNSTPLGVSYKDLSKEDSPISFQYGNYFLSVLVTSRARVELAGIYPFPNGPLRFPVPGGYMPYRVVFLERNGPGGQWTLNIPSQFNSTLPSVFWISAYWYPNPLVKGDDENAMTRDGNLSEAIIRMAAHYAFRAVNPTDPRGDAAKAQAEEAISHAMYTDVFISNAGRSMRM